MKKNLKRDVTPYEIAKYLKEVEQIEIAPQRIYRDRKDGRLASYRDKESGKWMVSVADAEAYINNLLSPKVSKPAAW